VGSELDEAFDRARRNLPDEWRFTTFTQDSQGWVASAARVWYATSNPGLSARGRTLTKALIALADLLEAHNEQKAIVGDQDH
jgi:hypothetical protein